MELLVTVNRNVRFDHTFFSEWKTSWLPSSFSRIWHWTMLLCAQNIQIDSYIHTRGRTSMDFAFAAIVNDFEALAASVVLIRPSSSTTSTLGLRLALRLCHCSKSLHRDPLHCFFFTRIYQFVSIRSTTATLHY